MKSLKQRLAEFGFNANQDFDYPVQCFLGAPTEHLRCLNIQGRPGRRKTAFGHALAHALGYEHVLYHEFTSQPESVEPVRMPTTEEEPQGEQPVEAIDQVISEACALSEGEKTILILDQLQMAPFVQHLRIADFLNTRVWSYADLHLSANHANLMLFLVSEEDLYHTLQQSSFRIWVDEQPGSFAGDITPQLLGLGSEGQEMLHALNRIFDALKVTPTLNEYQKIIHDIQLHVRTPEHLKLSLYGWIEDLDRNQLHSAQISSLIEDQMPVIEAFLGLDQEPIVLELHVPLDEEQG
jgi:hypothetical protein